MCECVCVCWAKESKRFNLELSLSEAVDSLLTFVVAQIPKIRIKLNRTDLNKQCLNKYFLVTFSPLKLTSQFSHFLHRCHPSHQPSHRRPNMNRNEPFSSSKYVYNGQRSTYPTTIQTSLPTTTKKLFIICSFATMHTYSTSGSKRIALYCVSHFFAFVFHSFSYRLSKVQQTRTGADETAAYLFVKCWRLSRVSSV